MLGYPPAPHHTMQPWWGLWDADPAWQSQTPGSLRLWGACAASCPCWLQVQGGPGGPRCPPHGRWGNSESAPSLSQHLASGLGDSHLTHSDPAASCTPGFHCSGWAGCGVPAPLPWFRLAWLLPPHHPSAWDTPGKTQAGTHLSAAFCSPRSIKSLGCSLQGACGPCPEGL